MQDVTSTDKFSITQLTAINWAKILTLALLAVYALVFGIKDFRQVLYLCLHGSYCLWWLLEQELFPARRQQLFQERVGLSGLFAALLFIGVFYSLPGYLAFTNPTNLSMLTAAVALVLYIFGSLINTSADIQKLTAKQWGASLVSDGI